MKGGVIKEFPGWEGVEAMLVDPSSHIRTVSINSLNSIVFLLKNTTIGAFRTFRGDPIDSVIIKVCILTEKKRTYNQVVELPSKEFINIHKQSTTESLFLAEAKAQESIYEATLTEVQPITPGIIDISTVEGVNITNLLDLLDKRKCEEDTTTKFAVAFLKAYGVKLGLITMQYIEGTYRVLGDYLDDLFKAAQGKPPPMEVPRLQQALSTASCTALARVLYIFIKLKIINFDLHGDNIMVDLDGNVQFIDFGEVVCFDTPEPFENRSVICCYNIKRTRETKPLKAKANYKRTWIDDYEEIFGSTYHTPIVLKKGGFDASRVKLLLIFITTMDFSLRLSQRMANAPQMLDLLDTFFGYSDQGGESDCDWAKAMYPPFLSTRHDWDGKYGSLTTELNTMLTAKHEPVAHKLCGYKGNGMWIDMSVSKIPTITIPQSGVVSEDKLACKTKPRSFLQLNVPQDPTRVDMPSTSYIRSRPSSIKSVNPDDLEIQSLQQQVQSDPLVLRNRTVSRIKSWAPRSSKVDESTNPLLSSDSLSSIGEDTPFIEGDDVSLENPINAATESVLKNTKQPTFCERIIRGLTGKRRKPTGGRKLTKRKRMKRTRVKV